MNKKRMLFLGLTLFWCYVIYSFSQSSGESSGSLSLEITQWILNMIYPQYESSPQVLELCHLLVRKGAHMTEYAILYCFSYQFTSTFQLKEQHIYLYPFIFSVGYAFLDEFHQLFVSGRAGRLMDVGIDTCGVLVMIAMILLVKKYVFHKKTML